MGAAGHFLVINWILFDKHLNYEKRVPFIKMLENK